MNSLNQIILCVPLNEKEQPHNPTWLHNGCRGLLIQKTETENHDSR